MDDRKFLDLLKNIQSLMRCPSCGSVYEVSEMQFMGSQEGYFLLSLNCAKCSLPVWVNVFAGTPNSGRSLANDLTIGDFSLSEREAIETNEVIDFSNYLKTFDGNFKKMFR